MNAKDVVDEYLFSNSYYSDESNDSIIDGAKIAEKHIEAIRQGVELDRGWLMPNQKIAELDKKIIVPLIEVEYLNLMGISNHEDKKSIYVLLSPSKQF